MSKSSISLSRAQAVEERLNLLRWLTKERIESIVEHVEGTNSWSTIKYSLQQALSATRTCDCIINYGLMRKILIKAKPITQTFLDSVKQLNQEKLLFLKYAPQYRNEIKLVIITYDRDQTDDQLLAGQGIHVIRVFDTEPYQPVDGV